MNLSDLFSGFEFHPVIYLPPKYEIYDFSNGYDPNRKRNSEYGIGRYNELRPGMYKTDLFEMDKTNHRDIHIGVDIAAPVGTAIHAFYDGKIFCFTFNAAPGDYGGTLITEHNLLGFTFWVLHGHLSHASVSTWQTGQLFRKGEIIARLGDALENGGWNPHLHFQLSLHEPKVCDMPGVVSAVNLEEALKVHPDPRLVLGQVY